MTAFRTARLEEMNTIDELVVSSINDLTQRHGFGCMASRSVPQFQSFCLLDDPRGLWIAEEQGEPIGFGCSWACENFWFLAQLFVKPGLQENGVGRELLRRAMEHGDMVGARQRALITFTFNTVSQGLYNQHGFFPRFPIYVMRAPRERPATRSGPTLKSIALEGTEEEIAALAEVDRAAIGTTRGKHHRLLMSEPGIRAVGVLDAGRLVGYGYASARGHIGPLAVLSPQFVKPTFDIVVELAVGSLGDSVSCFVPGLNEEIIRTAIQQGFRITFPMLMMSTTDIGTWPCYLPRNPGFM